MLRICITGFMGWGNIGDEGILLAIVDSLGENEYIVCTSLPWTLTEDYKTKVGSQLIREVRHIYDGRADYDFFILGGGGLSWGYGWRQALVAFAANKPSMNYAVGYSSRSIYHPRLLSTYREFLKQFDAITVRDEESQQTAEDIGVKATLSMCPAINLKEEEFDCPQNVIVVCPRYEDYGSNEPQIQWLTQKLADVQDEVLLVPFAPYNKEGVPVDLMLCRELKTKLPRSQILEIDGYSPRKVKYVISRSKKVVSGGRLHALIWASAHNIPFEASPTALANYPKISAFQHMHTKYGGEELKEMEKLNQKIFLELLERQHNE